MNSYKFVADSMLGRLAKWLRIIGYDTFYQPVYMKNEIDNFIQKGRVFITRNRAFSEKYPTSIFIHSDLVKDQILEMKDRGYINEERSKWFSLCSQCNRVLVKAKLERARKDIPEYVFYQNISDISYCKTCGRYYWPGSHKKSMLLQLEKWGITTPT